MPPAAAAAAVNLKRAAPDSSTPPPSTSTPTSTTTRSPTASSSSYNGSTCLLDPYDSSADLFETRQQQCHCNPFAAAPHSNTSSSNSSNVNSNSQSVGTRNGNNAVASRRRQKVNPPTDGDLFTAKELNALSLEEREQALEEVHGVVSNNNSNGHGGIMSSKELPDFDVWKYPLLELEQALGRISKKPAYERALFLSPKLVRSRKFRLLFLRAESAAYSSSSSNNINNIAKAAAQRMVHYFARKLELFGPTKLAKPDITQDDLRDQPGDLDTLRSGCCQLFQTDRAGRMVQFDCMGYYAAPTVDNFIRVVWYQLMKALLQTSDSSTTSNNSSNQDDGKDTVEHTGGVQFKGIVVVAYNMNHALRLGSSSNKKETNPLRANNNASFSLDPTLVLTREFMTKNKTHIQDALPFRYAALHMCSNDSRLRPILSFAQIAIGKLNVIKFRAHYGSDLENQYGLASFGIAQDILGVNANGELRLEAFQEQLQKWKREEEEEEVAAAAAAKRRPVGNTNSSRQKEIDYPCETDVLFGRGRSYQEYHGNLRLAAVVDYFRQVHVQSDRATKTAISKQVVRLIQIGGGRFLERTIAMNGGWVAVSDSVAREKVSHSFRTKFKIVCDNENGEATSPFSSPTGLLDGIQEEMENQVLAFLPNSKT
jgi:hypothetical protein